MPQMMTASSIFGRLLLASLLVVGLLGTSACPEGCKCVEMRTTCVGQNFTTLPTDIDVNTQELYMKVSGILL